MKLVVFGALGLIGTELKAASVLRGVEYSGFSRSQVDAADNRKIRETILGQKPDVVVNAMTLAGVGPSEDDPGYAFSVHACSARSIAEACSEIDAIYLHTSTNAIFDGTKREPYTEADRPSPINVYGVTKLAGEYIARAYCAQHYIVRFPLIYGVRRQTDARFVDQMVAQLTADQEIHVADDKIDSFTYAKDAANGLLDILDGNTAPGIYHLTNAGSASYYQFVCHLRDQLGSKSAIIRAKDRDFPSPGAKPLRSPLATNKSAPMRSWQAALEEYVDSERCLISPETKTIYSS